MSGPVWDEFIELRFFNPAPALRCGGWIEPFWDATCTLTKAFGRGSTAQEAVDSMFRNRSVMQHLTFSESMRDDDDATS